MGLEWNEKSSSRFPNSPSAIPSQTLQTTLGMLAMRRVARRARKREGGMV